MPPISARVLAALVAAGATPEQLVAAVTAEEGADEERKERRREKERIKKQKYRANRCPPMSPGTTGDSGGPPSFPPITPLSPPVVVGGGSARARTNDDAAGELANDLLLIFEIQPQLLPSWDREALARWLQLGLAGGWQPDVVRIAARKVAAQRRKKGPPNSFRYLEKPIVCEHALAARPVAPAPDQEEIHATRQRELTLVRPVSGFQQSRDDFRSARAELKDFIRTRQGGSSSG